MKTNVLYFGGNLELFRDKTIDMPPQTQTSITFAKAPKVSKKQGEQLPME